MLAFGIDLQTVAGKKRLKMVPGWQWARAEEVRRRPVFWAVRRSAHGRRFRPGPRPRDASTFSFNWTLGHRDQLTKIEKHKLRNQLKLFQLWHIRFRQHLTMSSQMNGINRAL